MADLRAAFSLADADAPPLAKGLDDKLSQAVTEAPILAPTSKKLHILGKQWKNLVMRTTFDEVEMLAFESWFEEAFGEEAYAAFVKADGAVTSVMPSFKASLGTPYRKMSPGPDPEPLESGFERMRLGAPAPAPAPAALAMGGGGPLPSSGSVTNKTTDESLQGMASGEIAILTFVLHTARLPPPGHEAA